MMASFDYNYQNPSLFLFDMLIKAIAIKSHWGFKIQVTEKTRKEFW